MSKPVQKSFTPAKVAQITCLAALPHVKQWIKKAKSYNRYTAVTFLQMVQVEYSFLLSCLYILKNVSVTPLADVTWKQLLPP